MNTIARDTGALNRRRFFVAMACAIIVAVFAGFAPTFYLRGSFVQTRPMSVLLHIHGLEFSAWAILFLVQSLLIARGSRRLHQRLGWVTAAVAVAMVALVGAANVEELRRVNGFPPPPLALSLSVFDITAFAILVGSAIYLLGRSDMNRVSLVGTLLIDAFFVPCFVYDLVTRRRVHPAFIIGFAIAIIDQVVQVWDLAYALQRWVA